MKKFKILGTIAIIVISIDIILYFIGNWNDISTSFWEGYHSTDNLYNTEEVILPHNMESVTLNVYPTAEMNTSDSLINKRLERNMPYKVTQVKTPIVPPLWAILFMFPLFLVVPTFLYGFICLIQLLLAIARKDIFNPQNIRRIRWFAYSLFAYSFLGTLFEWCLGEYAINQIDFPGYQLINNSSFTGEWCMIATIVLFAEIFAVAVKIKEEQDLTI